MIRTGLMALALGVALATARAQAQSDLVKRGDYLVNTIMTCGNCHTPKGPKGDIPGKDFSGGLSWDEPPFKVTAPNITPGQGDRHRQMERRRYQEAAAHRRAAERRARSR